MNGELPATMKAMLLQRPRAVGERPLDLVELPVPQPAAGEVLLRVLACGICHTDLHTVEGELQPHKSPVVPGHQIVGEVVAFGPGAADVPAGGDPAAAPLRLGERAGVPWLHRTCGHCVYCRSGQENLCEEAQCTGYDVDGGYAEYAVAPAAFTYRLPDMADLAVAPLLCAGIIGYRGLRLAGVLDQVTLPGDSPAGSRQTAAAEVDGSPLLSREPRRLGLYGFGAAAHIGLQVARHLGWEVAVFTRGVEHRRLALELGAVWAGSAGGSGFAAASPASPSPPQLDAAVIFAPVGDLVIDALRSLRKGGIVALGGIYSTSIPPIDYPLIYDERVVRSVANNTRADARELLALAPHVPVRTEVQVFALEEANEALLALKESRIRGAAVLQVG
jgi:propanol-preferring alcohol dehydrogenase